MESNSIEYEHHLKIVFIVLFTAGIIGLYAGAAIMYISQNRRFRNYLNSLRRGRPQFVRHRRRAISLC